jgi:energy-coupling factor transporter ATP-binding protein EcfA2
MSYLDTIKSKYDIKDHVESTVTIPDLPTEGIVLIVGTSGSGKTTILKTVDDPKSIVINNNKNVIATLAPGSMCLPANNGKHTFTDFTDMVIGNSYIEFSDISGLSSTNCFVIKVYYNEI